MNYQHALLLTKKIAKTLPNLLYKESNNYIYESDADNMGKLADGTYNINSLDENSFNFSFVSLLTCNTDGLNNWGRILVVNRKAKVRDFYRQFGLTKTNPVNENLENLCPQSLSKNNTIPIPDDDSIAGGNFNIRYKDIELDDNAYRTLLLMKNYSRFCMGTIKHISYVLNLFLSPANGPVPDPTDPNPIYPTRNAPQFYVTNSNIPLKLNIYYNKSIQDSPLITEAYVAIFEESDLLPRFVGMTFEFIYTEKPYEELEEYNKQYEKYLNASNIEDLGEYYIVSPFSRKGIQQPLPFDYTAAQDNINLASWDYGMGDDYTKVPGKDINAKVITQAQYNGIFNQISSNLSTFFRTGRNPGSNLFAARNNPYMINDMVWEGLNWLISLKDNNTAARNADGVNWDYLTLIFNALTAKLLTLTDAQGNKNQSNATALTYTDQANNLKAFYSSNGSQSPFYHAGNEMTSPSFIDSQVNKKIGQTDLSYASPTNFMKVRYCGEKSVVISGRAIVTSTSILRLPISINRDTAVCVASYAPSFTTLSWRDIRAAVLQDDEIQLIEEGGGTISGNPVAQFIIEAELR